MLSIVPARRDLKSNRNLFDGSNDLVASVLPKVDGSGLTQAECFRLNRAENRARAAYAADCPEADSIECHRVGALAAKDELRRLLKDRPAAPCCDPSELTPCSACLDLPAGIVRVSEVLPVAAAAVSPWDREYDDPSEWPDDTDNWFYETAPDDDAPEDPEPEPRLTLAGFIESEAAVMRAQGLAAYELMADHLSDLARIVRTVDATHPGQVWPRVDVLDRDFSEAWEMPEREPELAASGRFV